MKRIGKLLLSLGIVSTLLLTYSYAVTFGSECFPSSVLTVPDSIDQVPAVRQKPHFRMPKRMPSWWQTQPAWQDLFKTGIDYESVDAIAVQNNIIWVAANWRIIRFDTVNGESRTYDTFKSGDDPFLPLDILISKNGDLWIFMYSVPHEYVALAKYESQTDTFEIVSDNQNLLQKHPYREVPIFVDSQVLAETPDEKILLPFQGDIISYDPQLNIAQYVLPPDFPKYENGAASPVTSLLVHQNKVWFTVSNDKDLRSVGLQTGEVKSYGHVPSILDENRWGYMKNDYRPIAVDGLGRIWMGYFARLNVQPNGQFTWEQLRPPREFIITSDPDILYLWASLESIYTSTDGNLWFETMAGLIRYDIKTDQWCRSTPLYERYKVVEDDNGNLWMAINSEQYNGIYKYRLRH